LENDHSNVIDQQACLDIQHVNSHNGTRIVRKLHVWSKTALMAFDFRLYYPGFRSIFARGMR